MKSLNIANLYRGMSKLKLKINVNLPQLLILYCRFCGSNGEFERFGGFCVDCCHWAIRRRLSARAVKKPPKTQNPPNRSNSPFRATETRINNSRGSRYTLISSFKLDIPRYKFTILLDSSIFCHASLGFSLYF